MKRFIYRAGLIAATLIMLFATSCTDDYWAPGPPPSGWVDTFYDVDLTGRWQLVSENGAPVTGYDTNYMEFDGYGRGYYTYWDHGELYSENIGYYCETTISSYGDYMIYIEYEYSRPAEMYYWFNGRNMLYMQWVTTGGRMVTYVYQRVRTIP